MEMATRHTSRIASFDTASDTARAGVGTTRVVRPGPPPWKSKVQAGRTTARKVPDQPVELSPHSSNPRSRPGGLALGW